MVCMDQYYKLTRLLLFWVGQLPDDRGNLKYLSRVVLTTPIASYIFSQISRIIANKWQIGFIIRILPLFMFSVVCALKYGTCWVKTTVVKTMFMHIKLDWNALLSENEICVMAKYAAMGNFYGKVYATFVLSALIGFVTLAFVPIILDIVMPANVSHTHMLNLEGEYSSNTDDHYYFMIFQMQSLCLAGGICAAAADVLYISMTFHACGMYNIVRYRLEHLFDDGENLSLSRKVILQRMRIIHAVDYHLKCLEHLEHIKSCFLVSYVLQLFVVVLAIASLLVTMQTYLMTGNNLLALMYGIDLVGHYFLIFLLVLPSQRVVDYSSDLHYSTYSGHWYEAPVPTQKLLIFIMHKTQRSQVLSAAGIFDMSFMFFSIIVRISFSYFMVLASFQE